ncbi:hypothetical protein OE88DRAFT_837579 [Heliocybe sulcata]|uniref:DUF6697 domain-containing protein n=1 Tax=Heliocybe sulcata TaxID=5364 RepID=A0A5C3MT13_9AGAM|nr:hypothetical protein OE88DRAFT_837579 [Heliocybe sulcata]
MGAAGGEEFIEQEAQPLFVNVVNAAKHSSKCFFAGFYEIFKAEDLTLEEWKTIPKSAKDFYCQTAKQKLESCRNRTIEEIQADYDGGSRRPPCLRLRFAGFRNPKHAGNDAVQDIYQALVEYCSRPTLIRTDAEVVVTPGKRRIKLKDGGASLKRRRTVRLNEPL